MRKLKKIAIVMVMALTVCLCALGLTACDAIMNRGDRAAYHTCDFSKLLDEKEATCTEEGFKKWGCAWAGGCDKENVETLVMVDHDYQNVTIVTQPTCDLDGEKEYTCKNCNGKKSEVIGALGHNIGALVTIEEATCTEDGVKVAACTNEGCNYVDKTEEIKALGHNVGAVKVLEEATCQKEGLKGAKCSRCDYKEKTEAIPVADHNYVTYAYNNDAECGVDGTETAACSFDCGETDTKVKTGTALKHKYTTYTYNNDAECGVDGTETASCANGCGETDTRTKAGTALEHSYVTYVYNDDATCVDDGTETANCENGCGEKDTKTKVDTSHGKHMKSIKGVKYELTKLIEDGRICSTIAQCDFCSYEEPVDETLRASHVYDETDECIYCHYVWDIETDDYVISSPTMMKIFADKVNGGETFAGKTVKLGATFSMANTQMMPIGYDGVNIFKGTFDGCGYTIYDLTINGTAEDQYVGLFGKLNGTVKNLKISGATISGNSVVGTGTVCGSIFNYGLVENVEVRSVTVTGAHYVGGLVGYSYGSILNCSSYWATVTATPNVVNGGYDNGDKVGAIVGFLASDSNSKVSGCYVYGANVKAFRDVGGIAGFANVSAVLNNTVEYSTITVDKVTNAYNKADENGAAIVGRVSGGEVDASNVSNKNTVEVLK